MVWKMESSRKGHACWSFASWTSQEYGFSADSAYGVTSILAVGTRPDVQEGQMKSDSLNAEGLYSSGQIIWFEHFLHWTVGAGDPWFRQSCLDGRMALAFPSYVESFDRKSKLFEGERCSAIVDSSFHGLTHRQWIVSRVAPFWRYGDQREIYVYYMKVGDETPRNEMIKEKCMSIDRYQIWFSSWSLYNPGALQTALHQNDLTKNLCIRIPTEFLSTANSMRSLVYQNPESELAKSKDHLCQLGLSYHSCRFYEGA